MVRTSNRTSAARRRAQGRLWGMRRVGWVRIMVVDGHTRCEAVGTGHRLPTVRQVSLDTAMALATSGVPSVIRFDHGDVVPATAGG